MQKLNFILTQFSCQVIKQALPTTIESLVGLNRTAVKCPEQYRYCYEEIWVFHMAGSGVPDTMPAPEILSQHAQWAQKSGFKQ